MLSRQKHDPERIEDMKEKWWILCTILLYAAAAWGTYWLITHH